MSKIVHTEILLEDGTYLKCTPTQQGKYAHIADRFKTWGQTISFNDHYGFKQIFDNMIESRGSMITDQNVRLVSWRAHIAASLASFAKERGTTMVECGVHLGILSGAICGLLEKTGTGKLENFYLFDTFEGIPKDQIEKEGIADFHNENSYTEDVYSFVKGEFEQYPYVKVVQGAVPDVLEDYKDIKDVSYLSIDMNILYPEQKAMEFFWDRCVPGAYILLDDYGFAGHEKQQAYFDQFFRERNCVPMQLPTGQGLVFKI